jgi:nitroimidazol reductase NimA-like FMN-containing flavoprotein (pyridoxamine 5'-phosphate oxidase superfamily)
MDAALRQKILELLDQHRLMTVATNRPDGWPQATTVGYVNDGLTLYFLCAPQSQKAQNLARDDRISLTIDHDTSDPMAITGLSMAAHARAVDDPVEVTKALNMMPAKITRVCGVTDAEARGVTNFPSVVTAKVLRLLALRRA